MILRVVCLAYGMTRKARIAAAAAGVQRLQLASDRKAAVLAREASCVRLRLCAARAPKRMQWSLVVVVVRELN